MRVGRRISMAALNANVDEDLVMTNVWANIRLDENDAVLRLVGGDNTDGCGGRISLRGKNSIPVGAIQFQNPDAAGTGFNDVMQIEGGANPILRLFSHRITEVLDPTTAQDVLTHHVWANWTPTLTWTTGTPAAITTIARYLQIGKTIFFQISILSSDSNACTALVISDLPGTIVNVAGETFSAASLQRYGATGTTYIDPLAYIYPTDETIRFRAFQTATDGQAIGINVSGFYEVS
jgi:hypothetical protein